MPSSNILTTHIRNAHYNDIDQLIELRKLLLNEGSGYYVSQTPEDQIAWQDSYKKWLLKNIGDISNKNIIVFCDASDDEKIIGCAIGIIDERVPFKGCLNGCMGWVQTVVVHPKFRRQGIAELMMDYLFNWFRDHGVEKVALQSTEIAMTLYSRLGFSDSGEALLIKRL